MRNRRSRGWLRDVGCFYYAAATRANFYNRSSPSGPSGARTADLHITVKIISVAGTEWESERERDTT